ncbi:uncharacterized protein N7511_009878 [Penicillium nucicola]|uniref:uncharacterized protein n=1 Tax=Penicillium nucicola TaxID=1850975 RepID=UPI0025455141|nr:uncharacterized protein N7511_009878 [Penicillium nucicola]KAJ5748182.1 hypothetical protein N7511_009878 [Penicillium nucicola]
MHRRPILKLSHRAGWSVSAGLKPSLTALSIRRTLRSSASCLNTSDSSNGNDNDSSSGSAPAKPKFGSRWASKATKPAGLSAAEQAIRDSIVANNPPPPPPPQSEQQPEQQPRRRRNDQLNRTQNTRSNRHGDFPGPRSASRPTRLSAEEQNERDVFGTGNGQHQQQDIPRSNAFGAPRFGSRTTSRSAGLSLADQATRDTLVDEHNNPPQNRTESRQPRRSDHSNPFRNPRPRRDRDEDIWGNRPATDVSGSKSSESLPFGRERWHDGALGRTNRGKPALDWSCPSCMAHVFGSKIVCPFCRTSRPDDAKARFPTTRSHDNSARLQRRQPGREPSEETRKFQDLGRSFLPEFDSHQSEQPEAADLQDFDRAESRPKDKEAPKAEKEQKDKVKKNDWSWDMSKLEELENLESQEQEQLQKPVKRRDGRKGRQPQAQEAEEFDSEERQRLREERRRQQKEKAAKKAAQKAAKSAPAPLFLPEFISVSNLADVIGVRPAQFVARMEDMGFEDITYKDVLDAETAGLVAAEFNFEAIFDTGSDDLKAAPPPEDTSNLPTRPPVVTIMGHVDHGKTTILDWLRKSSVAASEHGGITQHIGAFSVMMPSGKAITFLDTPGHSAFLEMRRRGADVTDIVVLVVAADDSVKPQTIEAIKHATQANVPMIVAMSKIDKEGKNTDRVKGDLSANGVHVEDFGGDVQAIGVSGKTGEGMVELEEAIVALSEMLDHRADIHGHVEGWVLEATTKSHGRVATVLIRRGTLRPGDVIVAGSTWARVRTLRNEAGVPISEATPGMPVEIDGWRDQPGAGTELLQTYSEQHAKEVVDRRLDKSDTMKMGEDMVAINETRKALLEKRRLEQEEDESNPRPEESTGPKASHFILKADVDGSAEAVVNSIAAIGTNEVYANVLRSGVGPISEFDIEHAASAKGKLISFNQPIDPNMMRLAENAGVEILNHNIIYKLIDDVKATLSELLPPSVTTRVTGEAEVQQIFQITVKGRDKSTIAGTRVRNGMINRARKVRVIRDDKTVYDGTIVSLKNLKKDVTEMRKDTECGIGFEEWSDFQVGDHVQCYEEIFEKRYL